MYNHKDGINVRKLSKGDLPKLLVLKHESWWGTHTAAFINEDDQLNWYENLPSNCLVVIGEKEEWATSVCILSEVDWISRTAKISGSIFKDFRRQDTVEACCAAFVDFSFEMLNLHRLDAEVLDYNLGAQHYDIGFLKFVPEGRRRQAVYKCGRYYDSITMGLLRSEWEQQDRVRAYDGCCNTNFNLPIVDLIRVKRTGYLKGV